MNNKGYLFCVCVVLITVLSGCHRGEHHYNGYIENDTVYLAEPFSGILKHKHVHRGQYVKKNQLLFELDPYPEAYHLQEAEANLKQGNDILLDLKKPRRLPEIDAIKAQISQIDADIALATIRFKRNQILFGKKVIAPDTLDASRELLNETLARKMQYEANLDLAQLGARTEQIEAQAASTRAHQAARDMARWSLEQKKVYAPEDGFILDAFFRKGELVNAGAPIASLLTRSNMYIEFFVPLRDLHDVKLGQKITYQYLNTKERFQATVVYVSQVVEYAPPVVYSNDNYDKLVFRIKAKLIGTNTVFPGEPVIVNVEPAHA